MEDVKQLTATFKDKIKPYESRIANLEAQDESKQAEIDALKLLVRDLHYLLEELKSDKQLNSKHN